MSCKWDVTCIDCNKYAGISEANHADDFMRMLIRHKDAIASLGKLDEESKYDRIFLMVGGYGVRVSFFAEHSGPGHQLLACNEYGDLDRPCPGWFTCPHGCGLVACDHIDHPERSGAHQHKSAKGDYHYAGT